jgi:hypothetical protein
MRLMRSPEDRAVKRREVNHPRPDEWSLRREEGDEEDGSVTDSKRSCN